VSLRVWTVANQKGGVGKTTSVTTLAGVALKEGKRVLLIDTDPHASLGYYFGVDSDAINISLFDIFKNHENLQPEMVRKAIIELPIPGLHLLPSNIGLSTIDRAMGHHEGMGLVLKNVLQVLKGEYDLVIIDCPPVLGVLMVNALAACDLIIVPVQTEFLAIKGLQRMIKTLVLMGRSQDIEYRYLVVPTMFDRRVRASHVALEFLLHECKEHVWDNVVPIDTKFRDASLVHIPATHYLGTSRGVSIYKALFDYCMQREAGHVYRGR
jgi:chromosome partitioning protein